ncbi:hypothetical protein DAX92_28230, partial [Salmonella enterica subsp. enterica]
MCRHNHSPEKIEATTILTQGENQRSRSARMTGHARPEYADVTQRINAERHERSNERETYRNGYRDRQYNTRLGTLDLRIPK